MNRFAMERDLEVVSREHLRMCYLATRFIRFIKPDRTMQF